jgi:hypothetical protein
MTESRIPAPILVDDRPEFGPATLGDSLGLHAPVAAPSAPMASLPVPPLPPVVADVDERPETGIVAEAIERREVERAEVARATTAYRDHLVAERQAAAAALVAADGALRAFDRASWADDRATRREAQERAVAWYTGGAPVEYEPARCMLCNRLADAAEWRDFESLDGQRGVAHQRCYAEAVAALDDFGVAEAMTIRAVNGPVCAPFNLRRLSGRYRYRVDGDGVLHFEVRDESVGFVDVDRASGIAADLVALVPQAGA